MDVTVGFIIGLIIIIIVVIAAPALMYAQSLEVHEHKPAHAPLHGLYMVEVTPNVHIHEPNVRCDECAAANAGLNCMQIGDAECGAVGQMAGRRQSRTRVLTRERPACEMEKKCQVDMTYEMLYGDMLGLDLHSGTLGDVCEYEGLNGYRYKMPCQY